MEAFPISNRQRNHMGQVTFLPQWQALTEETRQAFDLLARLPIIHQFYLAGGTGLALHLGHRFSVDLGLFSPDPESVGAATRALLRETRQDPTLSTLYDQDGTFAATWRGVGIGFFRLHLDPLGERPIPIQGGPVATIAEIGAMKLAASIGRGTRKDLIGLYCILQKVPPERLFEVAAVRHVRVRAFASSAVRALAYFEAEALPMPRMIDRTPWPTMKRFLERQALRAGRKYLQEMWD